MLWLCVRIIHCTSKDLRGKRNDEEQEPKIKRGSEENLEKFAEGRGKFKEGRNSVNESTFVTGNSESLGDKETLLDPNTNGKGTEEVKQEIEMKNQGED